MRGKVFVQCLVLMLTGFLCQGNEEMYCEPDDCYRVLGFDRYDYPTAIQIKKAYRKLSKTLHPDRNLGNPNAESDFAKVARAYETLSNPESKKEYDYYLDHPEEMMMNKMKYYTRVYATKSDWKLVVLSILIGISGLQYVLQSKMHKQQLERIMKADTGLQVKVKRLAKERFDELQTAKGTISPSRKSKKKKASKEEEQKLLEIERQVADELAEQVQVEGSFKKPEIRDIIIVKILMLPYTLPMFVLRKGTWFVKHTVLKQPLTEEEKMYLLTSSLYRSEESLRQQYSPEELDLLMDMEGWDPDNFRRFEDEVASRKAGKKRGKKNRDNYYE